MTHSANPDHFQAVAASKTTPPQTRSIPDATPTMPKASSSSSNENPSLDGLRSKVTALEKEIATTRKRADASTKKADALQKRVQELQLEVRRLEKELEKSRRRQTSRSPSRPPATRQSKEDDVALRGRLAAADNLAKIFQLRCEQLEIERKPGAAPTIEEPENASEDVASEAEGVDKDGDRNNNVVDVRRIKQQLEVAERRVKNSLYITEAHENMVTKAKEREKDANVRATELDRKLRRALERLESIYRRDMIAGLGASCHRDEWEMHDVERELRAHQMDPELYLPVNTAKRRHLARSEKRLLRLRRRHESQLAALKQAQAVERLHSDLRSAVGCNDLSETKRLLSSGISVNAPDEAGLSAFLYACGQANEDLVRAMVDAGGDVLDGDGIITGLIIAARKTLICEGADVHARDSAGGTALHASVLRGHVDLSRVLLEAGSDCNAVDQGTNTPLHVLAAPTTHPTDHDSNIDILGAQLVSLLLEWGASTDIKNFKGLTPVTAALDAKRRSLVVAYQDFFGGDLPSLGIDRESRRTGAAEITAVGMPKEGRCGERTGED